MNVMRELGGFGRGRVVADAFSPFGGNTEKSTDKEIGQNTDGDHRNGPLRTVVGTKVEPAVGAGSW